MEAERARSFIDVSSLAVSGACMSRRATSYLDPANRKMLLQIRTESHGICYDTGEIPESAKVTCWRGVYDDFQKVAFPFLETPKTTKSVGGSRLWNWLNDEGDPLAPSLLEHAGGYRVYPFIGTECVTEILTDVTKKEQMDTVSSHLVQTIFRSAKRCLGAFQSKAPDGLTSTHMRLVEIPPLAIKEQSRDRYTRLVPMFSSQCCRNVPETPLWVDVCSDRTTHGEGNCLRFDWMHDFKPTSRFPLTPVIAEMCEKKGFAGLLCRGNGKCDESKFKCVKADALPKDATWSAYWGSREHLLYLLETCNVEKLQFHVDEGMETTLTACHVRSLLAKSLAKHETLFALLVRTLYDRDVKPLPTNLEDASKHDRCGEIEYEKHRTESIDLCERINALQERLYRLLRGTVTERVWKSWCPEFVNK